MTPLLAVNRLSVAYQTRRGRLLALDGIDFTLAPGEALALVGESGSGKSTLALATMGLLGPEAAVSGAISFAGRNLATLSADERRDTRGRRISMVFQDPFTSLNPSLTIGLQVAEPLIAHLGMPRQTAIRHAVKALADVGLPHPNQLIDAYPHQLSGGMQQRVLIATALICEPALVVLDEPTTALDVTVEARILDLLDDIRRVRGIGMLFITHNLGVVNRIADRVGVIYAGHMVEIGAKSDVLGAPCHPYTKGLLASLPRLRVHDRPRRLAPIGGGFPDLTALPGGCIFAPRCPFAEARCQHPQPLDVSGNRKVRCWKAESLHRTPWPIAPQPEVTAARSRGGNGELTVTRLAKHYPLAGRASGVLVRRFGWMPWPGLDRPGLRAVDGVSFKLGKGEVLGLVGESGSGKSTLARLAIRLIEPTSGDVAFAGKSVAALRRGALKSFRRAAQIVFQNPDSSLNPRRTVGEAIARAVKLHTEVPARDRRRHVEDLMERTGLPRSYYDRYPHQLSGGEKQRIGIARALATNPELVVCDEPVSALDVSVQATILNLLSDLRDEFDLSYLFISHDIAIVAHIADRIAVMYAGKIVEIGSAAQVLEPPCHPYTEALLAAIPSPDPTLPHPGREDVRTEATAAGVHAGCPFHPRCARKIGAVCETVMPPVAEVAPGHHILCHIPLADLKNIPSPLPAAKRGDS